jgi:hypothetical protein
MQWGLDSYLGRARDFLEVLQKDLEELKSEKAQEVAATTN